MGRQGLVSSLKLYGIALAATILAAFPLACRAADLPLATSSPLVGLVFDDKPLVLPMQRNFQMAMLTASTELGRSCGRMESYGWRMSQSEQSRVDQIFNTTVGRLRTMGYQVEAQSPPSVSHDITLFTVDRAAHHFIFMWSAGEIGLVMVLCETPAPLGGKAAPPMTEDYPKDVVQSKLETPVANKDYAAAVAKFTPLGNWVGNYTCTQGYTGGTLSIKSLKGEDFEGTFHFYPTAKNPYVPSGRYTVYGQYDKGSQRILINPGKWLDRPKNYYNTVLVGSFDPVARSFSAYFQGITGCTSFEAKYTGGAPVEKAKPKKHKAKKKKKAPAKTAAKPNDVALPSAVPATPAATAAAPTENPATVPAAAPAEIPPATAPATSVAPAVAPSPPAAPAPAAAAKPTAAPAAPAPEVPAMPAAPDTTVPPPSSIMLPSGPPPSDDLPAPVAVPGK